MGRALAGGRKAAAGAAELEAALARLDAELALVRPDLGLVSVRTRFSERPVVAALEARGGGLHVLHGRARDAIPRLARSLGVVAVYANRDYEPQAVARDARPAGEGAGHDGQGVVAATACGAGSRILSNTRSAP